MVSSLRICSTTVALFSSLVLGQKSGKCQDKPQDQSHAAQQFDQARLHANATGSYTYPAPSAPGIPDGNWTWNITVSVNADNETEQEFSIGTPNLRGLKVVDIPYQVCVIAFYSLPGNVTAKGQNDNGDCMETLDQACVSAITSLAQQTTGTDAEEQCDNIEQQMQHSLPSECQAYGSFGGNSQAYTLFSPPSSGSGFTPGQCFGKDSNTVQTFFGTGLGSEGAPLNETVYDNAIYQVVPFLTTTITNQTLGGGESSSSSQSRLICMRAKDIEAGSKAPPALGASTTSTAPSTSATSAKSTQTPNGKSGAMKSREMTLGGVVGVALLAALFS